VFSTKGEAGEFRGGTGGPEARKDVPVIKAIDFGFAARRFVSNRPGGDGGSKRFFSYEVPVHKNGAKREENYFWGKGDTRGSGRRGGRIISGRG